MAAAAKQKAIDNMAIDISAMSAKMSTIMEKMVNMENLLTIKLGEVVKNQAAEITTLKDRINDHEQYARSWSM